MSGSRVTRKRVAHKSTGGILCEIPQPVDPVGNAHDRLTSNTVAYPCRYPIRNLVSAVVFGSFLIKSFSGRPS